MALKTDVLGWATASFNIEPEVRIGKKATLALGVSYNPWTFNDANMKWKHIFVQPEFRFWTCHAFDGHFFGIHPFYAHYNIGGIRTGIATSNYKEMVDACLDSLSIRGLLDVVCTACEVKRGKPSPDIYLYAADKLKVDPGRCLVFEDIPAGIRAGKAAGMLVGAVADEFSRDMEPEKKALSDFFIEDYSVFL